MTSAVHQLIRDRASSTWTCMRCANTWDSAPPRSDPCCAYAPKRKSGPKPLTIPEVRALRLERPYPDPAPGHGIPEGPQDAAIEATHGERLHLKLNGERLLHTHVANERRRSRQMQALEAQGLLKGCPDYRIWRLCWWPDLAGNLIPRPGIDIELKRLVNWKVSQNQATAIRAIWAAGGIAELAWGWRHAWAIACALYQLQR